MLRMTLLLCIGMYATLMIAGEDRGQMRPGLARALAEGRVSDKKAAAIPDDTAITDTAAKVEAAPIAVAAAPAPKVAAPLETPMAETPVVEPYVEPERKVVQALKEPVFTLSSLGNELVPGEAAATDRSSVSAAPEPSAEAVPSGEGTIWYVTASSVNVRQAPSTDSEVLGKLAEGEAALVVTEVEGEWARIIIQGDGMEGYVAMRYLSPVESPGTP